MTKKEELFKRWENGCHLMCRSEEDIRYVADLLKEQKDPKNRLTTPYATMFKINNWICFTCFFQQDENGELINCIDSYVWSDKMSPYTNNFVFIEDYRKEDENAQY